MIQLKREKPLILTKLEILKYRLSENHPKMEEINKDFHSFKAGYQGEVNMDYYFSLMDQDKYDFYHGLRLPNGKSYHQIDTLIATNRYILAAEIKKLSGTIVYDKKTNQFTQNSKPIINPFSQVKLQKLQFVDWLQNHNFSPITVDFLIPMANNSTKIEYPSGTPDQYWKLCYGHDLLEKIQIYDKTFKVEHFTSKDRKRLKKFLLKEHTPLDVDVLKKYELSKGDLITGVLCPQCKTIPMSYTHGLWICPICQLKSKDEHIRTVQEHFLIIKPTITNKDFREITHIQSRQIASRLLVSMNLPNTGTNSSRIYYSPNFNHDNSDNQTQEPEHKDRIAIKKRCVLKQLKYTPLKFIPRP
jgi:uncharacterized Zn finger protein (UPF0148 family)